MQNTITTKVIETDTHEGEIQKEFSNNGREKIVLRGFKSLNRKGVLSPRNCNLNRLAADKQELIGKENIKDSINSASDHKDSLVDGEQSLQNKMEIGKKVKVGNSDLKKMIENNLAAEIGLIKPMKTQTEELIKEEEKKIPKISKLALETLTNRGIENFTNRSAKTNINGLSGKLKEEIVGVYKSNPKKNPFQHSPTFQVKPESKSPYSYSSPLKGASKFNLGSPTSTENFIINETVSKDGHFKVMSRAFDGNELKEAVELEYAMNLKSKKQAISLMQQPSSPRQKYILDPSKISNKENGNIYAYAVNSNQGISRKYNEDRVSIILNISKNGIKSSFFAIYDGHGGSNCCDFLTQNLHQYIFNSKKFPAHPRQAIIEGIKLAEEKFIERVKTQYSEKQEIDRSGSCAIIALIVGDDCYIANVGDSRAILSTCQGKPMYSLSRDHKPTDIGEQTRIFKEGGKIYRTEMTKIKKEKNKVEDEKANQINGGVDMEVIVGPLRVLPGKLSVTRTFGDIEAKLPEFGGIENCISTDPEICKYSLTGKEDFIILGCDGIFEKLDSEEVIDEAWRSIKKNKGSNVHEAVGQAAQSVVKLCMDRKSTDNLTTIIISFGSLGVNNNLGDYASV